MTSVNYEIEGISALDEQVALLAQMPKYIDEKFRPAMEAAVEALSGSIKPLIPVKTGHALETFSTQVRGSGIRLYGRVGWWGADWYHNVVNYGSKPHLIMTNPPGGWLAVGDGKDREVTFTRVVHHPGFAPRLFMERGFESARSQLVMLFGQAGNALVDAFVLRDLHRGGGRASYNKK